MIDQKESEQISEIINSAATIAIIQADNPDADSLGSALALEEMIENLGKKVILYCGVGIPGYLSYVKGWDRVVDVFPKQFDASIIVDASTKSLLQKLEENGEISWIAAKPCIVLDHHASVQNNIDFAEVSVIDPLAASTGVIILELAKHVGWEITAEAAEPLLVSILGDTQGLTNSLATSETYRAVANLLDSGADRVELEERRREQSKMPQKILNYKATLIQKTRFSCNDAVAYVIVPQNEINEYSSHYNPGPLIQGDLLQTENVRMAIVFKTYDSGRVTGSIRCNNTASVANTLAEEFGGGGHAYAAGFKINNTKDSSEIIAKVVKRAEELVKEQDAAV